MMDAFQISRRQLLATGAVLLTGASPASARTISDIESALTGRIGVAAYDLSTGRTFEYRADERFAMCSTFKASLAAAVLARADRNELEFTKSLKISAGDLLPNSPVVSMRPLGSAMQIDELCAAIVISSDNTAANMLLNEIGGPHALTRYFRSIEDDVSRLDRLELDLNSNIAGDLRDTTTPRAMARNIKTLIYDDGALSPGAKQRLLGWMLAEKNGIRRIRAGMPTGWQVANKPGTSLNGAVNDIALVRASDRSAVAISIYTNAPGIPIARSEQAIAEVARIACEHLTRSKGQPKHQS